MPRVKYVADNKVPYDKVPVQIKVLPGVRNKLKAVPDWRERLRTFIDSMVEESLDKDD